MTPPRAKATAAASNGKTRAQPEPAGTVLVHVYRDENGNTQLVPGATGDIRITEIGDILRAAETLWDHQQRQRITGG